MKIKITSRELLYPEQPDYVLIQLIDGIKIKSSVRIQLPLGHDVNDCIVETSQGDGWENVKMDGKTLKI